jgi:hypothetical protein
MEPRSLPSEKVAAFDRNAWPRSIGLPGRNRRNPHKATNSEDQYRWLTMSKFWIDRAKAAEAEHALVVD